MDSAKKCYSCNKAKPASEFSPNMQQKDGLNGKCKQCRRSDNMTPKEKVMRALYITNPQSPSDIALVANIRIEQVDNCAGGLIKAGLIKVAAHGAYGLAKKGLILRILDESGPCSHDLLILELKGLVSHNALYLVDKDMKQLIDTGFVMVNGDGAYYLA